MGDRSNYPVSIEITAPGAISSHPGGTFPHHAKGGGTLPESRIRSVRELRCGVWEVDIIDASRKRLRRRFRAESADGARAAALASLPGPKACTLAEALDRYFEILTAKGAARKTVANY